MVAHKGEPRKMDARRTCRRTLGQRQKVCVRITRHFTISAFRHFEQRRGSKGYS